MTIDEQIVNSVRAALDIAGIEDPAAEARLIAHEVVRRGEPSAAAMAMAQRRAAGTPLAYVIGRVEFLGLELLTGEGVIIPRKETELLARIAKGILTSLGQRPQPREPWVVDMCCGSGNLACAIAYHHPSVRVWASDLTDGCVGMASRNAAHLGIEHRVVVRQGDLFASLEGHGLEGEVDVVVCNPPYISSGKLLRERADLLRHEPREAFDGGPYGLTIHQRVIREAMTFLRPGGWLLFEMGLGQHRQLELLFRRSGGYEAPMWAHDDQQQPRVAMAQKKAGS